MPLYAEPGRVFSLTVCTRRKKPEFAAAGLAQTCADLLRQVAWQCDTRVYAYCLMPDHCHLLAGPDGDASVIEFIGQWKRKTDYAFRKAGGSGRLWQRSFYDHALRDEESIEAVARYILNNPVRAGLVEGWRDYPFSGSSVLDR